MKKNDKPNLQKMQEGNNQRGKNGRSGKSP